MSTRSLVILAVSIAVVVAIGWFATDSLFLSKYSEIRTQTIEYERKAESFGNGATGSREIKVGLRDVGRTMLGAEQNVVEHRLRALVSELAERNGLSEVVVTHGRPRIAQNPADDRASRIGRSLRKRLGAQTDFAVIRGRVQGIGELSHVVAVLAELRAQPWLHRVEGFTLEPRGRDRKYFELKADFATIFAPDLVDSAAPAPVLVAAVASDTEAFAQAVTRRPFRFADPKAPAPVRPPPPVGVLERPSAPPPPPYDKWRVTGVLETLGGGLRGEKEGVEVLLARTDTGESRTLRIGQVVLGATLTGASGEQAWFDKDGVPVVVRAGETLDQARPAETVHSKATSPG